MNPIELNDVTSKKIVPKVIQTQVTHSSKTFYPKPLSFSNKLFFDVGNTLMTKQQESE